MIVQCAPRSRIVRTLIPGRRRSACTNDLNNISNQALFQLLNMYATILYYNFYLLASWKYEKRDAIYSGRNIDYNIDEYNGAPLGCCC